jgi:hypothetical protein
MAVPEDAVAPNIHYFAPFARASRVRRVALFPDLAGAQAGTFQATVTYIVKRIQNQLIVTASVGMTAPYWHWYVDGAWRGMNRTGIFTVTIRDGEQADVLAFPTNDANFDPIANAPRYFSAVRTIWFNESPDSDTSYYLVQQATGASPGAYATIDSGKVWHRDGTWQYHAETRRLTDLTYYWFRVVPYDRAGNAGTPVVFISEYIVRRPDAPAYTSSFATGTITVS